MPGVFDRAFPPDIAAADIRSGVTVGDITGTLDVDSEANLPPEPQVLTGNLYGSANQFSGQYVGVEPGNVRKGTAVGVAPAVGTLVVPSEDDVRLGTGFGDDTPSFEFTGNVRVPPPERVQEGYAYDTNDTVIGTLPTEGTEVSADDVRFGVPASSGVGNLIVPDPSDVTLNVAYDSNGSVLGTNDCTTGTPDSEWIG